MQFPLYVLLSIVLQRRDVTSDDRFCSVDAHFKIDIRVNYDEDNKEEVPELLDVLSTWFGDDERFQILIRPVGRWGGPNDELIPVCDRTAAESSLWDLTEYGLRKGLPLSESIVDILMPAGAVCYAAKPNSLVIGANGQLYKCSVALYDNVPSMSLSPRMPRQSLPLIPNENGETPMSS